MLARPADDAAAQAPSGALSESSPGKGGLGLAFSFVPTVRKGKGMEGVRLSARLSIVCWIVSTLDRRLRGEGVYGGCLHV